MPSQIPETLDLIEAVFYFCIICFLVFLILFLVMMLLTFTLVLCHAPLVALNKYFETGILRWSLWEVFLSGVFMLLGIALLGVCIELLFFFGWHCFMIARGKQARVADYTLLSTRVYRAVQIVYIRIVRWYVFLLDTLLPRRGQQQEKEDLDEKQGHV
ncbi:hypothetical protein GGS24DRAFT_474643 [Hypoxylon argillaceum]|nr:hypothetical protein GGS24DRAFT_474643 [Hypoxylon argillaceum]